MTHYLKDMQLHSVSVIFLTFSDFNDEGIEVFLMDMIPWPKELFRDTINMSLPYKSLRSESCCDIYDSALERYAVIQRQ